MIRFRHWLPLCSLALLAIPALSCGPDFPTAIFAVWPDGPYPAFAAGHLGVPIVANAHTRDLVIAYDYLTGHALTTSDQQQANDVNNGLGAPWEYEDAQKKNAPASGFETWITARTKFGPVDGYTPTGDLELTRAADGNDYNEFPNCLDDAFTNAARTFASRSTAHGAKDPSVIEWVRGQDAVFSNCGSGKPRPHYGSGEAPPPPPPNHLPTTLTNAPAWLQQDRAYQLAAAHFYAMDYDQAIAGFRAIAADTNSPWSTISRYLIARAYIRQATVTDDQLSDPAGDEARQTAAAAKLHETLGLAKKELVAMLTEKRMAPMHDAVSNLLDYVNLRYEPGEQAATLAQRLHTPGTPKFGQSLIDITYLRYNPYAEPKPLPEDAAAKDKTGMVLWIETMTTEDGETALDQWHTTHSNVWLLAALTFAEPGDANAAALIRAAQAVPQNDPAWTGITYNRLRLMPRGPATHDELLKLVPQFTQSHNTSTINLFTKLNAASAPTLDTWLAFAGRTPAGEDDGQYTATADATPPSPQENVCGTKVPPGSVELFDVDAAYALNNELPLRLLAAAAENKTLPANLRYQIAQATWARAVLLDKPEIAHRMTPLLIACRAAWKPVLATYDAASTPDARHTAGLLALMRFASIEPSVREGEERREGFATYDEFRQNWWCSAVPGPGDTVDLDTSPDSLYGEARAVQPDKIAAPLTPLFLTPTDLAEARTEVTALKRIPRASTYFATQALAWQKAHPTDPHNPELLGEAFRAVRNSCRKDLPYDSKTSKPESHPGDMTYTPNLAQALFETLHHNYPNSTWTERYTSWE